MPVTLCTPRQRLFGGSLLVVWLWSALASAQTTASPEPPEASVDPAAADATKLACAKAYEMSQRLRQDGKLLRAREQALACAQPTCPALLVGDCTGWLAELDSGIASVIIEVKDAQGQSLNVAQLIVDGEPLPSPFDGRALPLDPGPHRFRVRLTNGKSLERSVVVTEGQKGQALRFELPAEAAAPAAPPASRRPSALSYGAAAFAVMGGVGFAYFGLQGRADEKDLKASCAPSCSDSELAPVTRTYLAADISLGVGVAALGLLGYLWLSDEGVPQRAAFAKVSSQGAAFSFGQRF